MPIDGLEASHFVWDTFPSKALHIGTGPLSMVRVSRSVHGPANILNAADLSLCGMTVAILAFRMFWYCGSGNNVEPLHQHPSCERLGRRDAGKRDVLLPCPAKRFSRLTRAKIA